MTEVSSLAEQPQDDAGADRASVAVIVVHGVADQLPGSTAAAFVEMMVACEFTSAAGSDEAKVGAAAGEAVRYRACGTESFTLPVPVLPPQDWVEQPADFDHSLRWRAGKADQAVRSYSPPKSDAQTARTGDTEGEKPPLWIHLLWLFKKALMQSGSSDFFRASPGADNVTTDRGLAYTHYLLGKAKDRTPSTQYTSQRTRLVRTDPGGTAATQKIDVWEMFWADQSRLSSALPRIATELFTMFFRLSRLGRDAVDEARRHAGAVKAGAGSAVGPAQWAWKWFSRLQTTIDWAFTYVLAQLFFQLLLVGLFLVLLDVIAPPSTAARFNQASGSDLVLRVAGFTIACVALLVAAYFSQVPRRALAALVVAAIGGTMVMFPPFGFALFLSASMAAAYGAILSWAEDRFPFSMWSGGFIGVSVMVATACHVVPIILAAPAGTPLAFAAPVTAGLTAFEYVLWAIRSWFIAMALPFAAWALLSVGLTLHARFHRDYQGRGGAATGRLGTLVSMLTFLLVAMALWAALSVALGKVVSNHCYQPAVWTSEPADESCEPLLTAQGAGSRLVNASTFADHRFKASTQTFTFNALAMAAILVYLAAMLVPSLLAELQIVMSRRQPEARRLGRWLTWFYRHLDRAVLVVTLVGAVMVVLVGARFLGWRDLKMLSEVIEVARVWSGGSSETLLRWFVIPAAGSLAALTVFGGVLSRLLPGLRAPLDAALDVDNYMREFPRQGIPRVLIFSRYKALLDAVRQRGYDRVVFVSHSQGTVISTELLRYLASEGMQRAQAGRRDRLKKVLNCQSVRLLTLGCPLRQLYASRFPALYRWIIDDDQRVPDGPQADDVGADIWLNAFGSGDYVGRWLWSAREDGGHDKLRKVLAWFGVNAHLDLAKERRFHPLDDKLCEPQNPPGRELAYDSFKPMPPAIGSLLHGTNREAETCIGFAAHTHYFDPPKQASDVPIAACLADCLIAG